MSRLDSSNELLVLTDVIYRFGGVNAVNGISITIKCGEAVALLGPNGAGKTTLLNLISGLLIPTAGQITFKNVPMDQCSVHRRARMGMRRTFQRPRNFPTLTAMDNLLIGNVQKRMMWWQVVFGRRDELYLAMQARFTSQYGRDIEDRFPLQLAHGDQRRLEVLSCLSSEPVLLLLDEPGAGLNSDEKSELADLLRAARRSYPISYLVVDHDLSFIEMICDRSVVMNSGTMVVESDIAPPASAGAVSAAGGHEVDAC